ncbi:MAG: Hint domain-containing protein [Amylibacter sp.]
MVDHVNEAIFLGAFTDFNSDAGVSLVGFTTGSAGHPVSQDNVVDITHNDRNKDGVVSAADNEAIIYSQNGEPKSTSGFDYFAIVTVTITYTDGTPTFTGNYQVNQTQDGNVFLISWGHLGSAENTTANAALEVAPIESIEITGIALFPGGQRVPNQVVDIRCFTKGTMILTGSGEKPVEHLMAGDMIATKDNGMQTIRWIGSTTVPATGDFAPIMIQKGAMGNARNLRVSPQHRMLFEGWKAELLFGEREVLVAAKYLVNQDTIYVSEGDTVEYFHILFDVHQIIFANGTPSESFHPGKLTIEALAKETREEIYNLFPDLQKSPDAYGSVVRTSLKKHEAKVLSENPDFLSYKSNHHPTINL